MINFSATMKKYLVKWLQHTSGRESQTINRVVRAIQDVVLHAKDAEATKLH